MTATTQPNYDRTEALIDTLDGMTHEEKVTATSWVLYCVAKSVPADQWRHALEVTGYEIQRRRMRNKLRRVSTHVQMADDANHIEWKEPPSETHAMPEERITAECVAAQLRSKPSEWALIARNQSAAEAYSPWWAPLMADDRFEVRTVPSTGFMDPLRVGEPFDTYARWLAAVDRPTHDGVTSQS
jgi:hypothetical protein